MVDVTKDHTQDQGREEHMIDFLDAFSSHIFFTISRSKNQEEAFINFPKDSLRIIYMNRESQEAIQLMHGPLTRAKAKKIKDSDKAKVWLKA